MWFRDLQRLRPGHDVCEGQMIHKPRQRELSFFLAAHCLDKIHKLVKFRQYIPSGSEVTDDKEYFANGR